MLLSTVTAWCTTRICSLGLVSLFGLLYLALWHSQLRHRDEISNSQLVLVFYTLLIHVLGLAFPLRLCYATWRLTKNMKRSMSIAARKNTPRRPTSRRSKEQTKTFRTSEIYSDDSSLLSDVTASDTEFSASIVGDDESIGHAIIIPNYEEDINTLRETLKVLACHLQASSSYEISFDAQIYLAMEQGEEGSVSKANILITEFTKHFRGINYTLHPQGIKGEAQGKSSNLSWAGRNISTRYKDTMVKMDMILTVIDADSHLSTRYFTSLTDLHLAYPETSDSTIYVPPIVFDRNAHLVPRLIRVADLLWSGAGMSGHYESSSICPPTSVYSLPLTLVDQVGGWDADEGAIGEDLHMYIKSYFALHGNLTTRTVLSAASQSNIHSSGQGIQGLFMNLNARYKQALRHMWGAPDSGYAIKYTADMCWKAFRGRCDQRPKYLRTVTLLHRMFEAHFLPTHITLILLTTTIYTLLTPKTHIPNLLQQSLLVSDRLRLLSLLTFARFFMLYESFHSTCVEYRELEMIAAGLAGKMDGGFSYRKNWRRNVADYVMFPIAGVIFGSVPSVVAQISQLWTLCLVYRVSKKPDRKGAPCSDKDFLVRDKMEYDKA